MIEYGNAFFDLWDQVLSKLPNGVDDISQTLEREFILRRFNRSKLNMEEATGSANNSIIGIGMRTDKDTGIKEPVSNFYPSYHRNIINAFKAYPIVKYFGITPDAAMALPVDRWHEIRKAAKEMADKPHVDIESQLMQVIQHLTAVKEVGG